MPDLSDVDITGTVCRVIASPLAPNLMSLLAAPDIVAVSVTQEIICIKHSDYARIGKDLVSFVLDSVPEPD